MLHILRSLKSSGKGAVILPHGVLFRGNVEAEIRKNIVRRGYIKGIIGLPPNLFYGTGIPACIIVLDKENAAGRTGIFMIDASKGFVKDGNKNRLRHQDIRKIVDVFTRQIELPKYSRMVSVAEIETHDYNLNIPRYIDSTEPEDVQDIEAHLLGGIPNRDIDDLAEYWQVFPRLRDRLFAVGERPGYSQLKAAAGEIKPAIFAHPEFVAYTQAVNDLFAKWKAKHTARLKGLVVGGVPKSLIEALAEDLLLAYASEHYGEQATAPDLTWTEDYIGVLISELGCGGDETFRWAYTAEDWAVVISYRFLAPKPVVYGVSVENLATHFYWEGEVDAAGQVTQQSQPR